MFSLIGSAGSPWRAVGISESGESIVRPEVSNMGFAQWLCRRGRAMAEEALSMVARTIWKGFLRIAEVSCPVALYTAASTSDRITLHTLNRVTGNRVRRLFVDSDTGDLVAQDDQVKGYEASHGDYIMLDPDEVEAAVVLSRIRAAPSARLGHLAFEGQGAFSSQC